MANLYYHATTDVAFSARAEFVPARECFPGYFRLYLGKSTTIFADRNQLREVMAAIAAVIGPEPDESTESYEAIAALQECREHPVTLTAPEFTAEPIDIMACLRQSLGLTSESGMEQARR